MPSDKAPNKVISYPVKIIPQSWSEPRPTLQQLLFNCIPHETDYESIAWSKSLYKQMN